MKTTDLLDIMGEIDANYIEDAAGSAGEHKPVMKQPLSRYGAIAAAIAILSISVYTISGVVRDGIMQTQPPQTGYTSTAGSTVPAVTSDTQSDTEAAPHTLPTDLFVIETLESTTATTETEKSLPFPANAEKPDASLEQKIGDRFLVNAGSQIVESGVFAMTVQKAECFDTLEESGLSEDDLLRSFREGYAVSGGRGIFTDTDDKEEFAYAKLVPAWQEYQSLAYIEEHAAEWRFVLLTINVENLNAVSYLPYFWNECRMPADPFRYFPNTGEDDIFDPFGDDAVIDPAFARDYDFSLMPMRFNIHKADERSGTARFFTQMAYCNLAGTEYNDVFRSDWFHLEPLTAKVIQIGAFLPKTLTPELMSYHYQDESEWDEKYPRYGEDLKNYYFFGVGTISKPHVDLRFDDPES